MKDNEKMLNVPLVPDVRERLDKRAAENGRAASREAAAIIEAAVAPSDGRVGAVREI